MADQTPTADGRPSYCLHKPHPSPRIEAKAREIYMARYGDAGGWWELVETPQCWWEMAERELAPEVGTGFVSTKNLPIDAEPF